MAPFLFSLSEALEGLVNPDFARCVVPGPAPAGGRRYGGIDFGFRNPFVAVWGTLDRDGVLWLTGEHYQRRQPLSRHLPRENDSPRGAVAAMSSARRSR
jgi:hypothetical protein